MRPIRAEFRGGPKDGTTLELPEPMPVFDVAKLSERKEDKQLFLEAPLLTREVLLRGQYVATDIVVYRWEGWRAPRGNR